MASDKIIREVYKVLEERRDNPIDSYTSKIMQDSDKKAEDKILEKVAEECGEVLLAAKNDENLVYESVDLIFHTLLILVYKGIEIDEIFEEFARRRHWTYNLSSILCIPRSKLPILTLFLLNSLNPILSYNDLAPVFLKSASRVTLFKLFLSA